MKAHVLAIPLVFSLAACSAPVDPESGTQSQELIRGGAFDPGGVVVILPDYCAGATATISAAPGMIDFGGSTTVQWSVNVPAGCTSQVKLSGEAVGASGSKVVKPLSTSSYVVTIGNHTLATTTVDVKLPSTVRINGNTGEWKALLVQAVGTKGTRVVLAPTIDMDLTGYENIIVRQGVTLTSEKPAMVFEKAAVSSFAPDYRLPGVVARDARTLGPRLYTTSRPKTLFSVDCDNPDLVWGDNVKFEGFRLQGPHYETMDGDDNLERGIQILSCTGVEVSNMEVSGFSGASIYVADPKLRQVGPGAVRVHDNYIHNNQHVGGNGYGVDVGASAWVTIERNVFDFNRHAIAGSGKLGTSYIADRNLVLEGGGVHDKWYNHYTHLFDVHGDANCDYLPGEWAEHIWNCGNAGDYFEMTNNAFQYTNDHAIKLRGVPRQKAKIHGNVFAHDDVGDAVETFDDTNVEIGPNTADFNPFGKYGVCDFDGDGKDDLFLATGASWWFSSGGKMQWTYLNSYDERLDQVGLGDFDGDKRCDVFAVNRATGAWQISKGGTSAWTTLPYSVPLGELRFGDFDGDGITDVFRRAPDGQWWAISPGIHGWTPLQSSSIPLADLRFGDFDGDGITDVMKRNESGCQLSSGAVTTWQPWSSSTADPKNYLVADVDGFPGEDLVRYVATSPISGRWEVSSQGRNPFVTLATVAWEDTPAMRAFDPAHSVRANVGRFKGLAKADLLAIDFSRLGRIASLGATTLASYSLYAY